MANIKNCLLILIVLLSLSCENQPELNGKWVILKLNHRGKEIYPQTVSEKIRITYNIVGYEGAEKIDFKTMDSTAIFPGFRSDEIKVKFSRIGDTLSFELINNDLYKNKAFDLAKEVFLQNFELITLTRKDIIELKSDLTFIKLMNEEEIIGQRINDLLR